MRNIILLATYWNESEWIEASLEQILRIDPVEIVICDGNFDPAFENRSTDGTRETILRFVKRHPARAKFTSAERTARWGAGLEFFKNAGCPGATSFSVGRARMALLSQFVLHRYRVNQALTFSKMARMSERWAEGRWVMSYDADQFYTDELIDFFDVTNRPNNVYDLLLADEYTFPFGFDQYTERYEKRQWNNMPHRIQRHMAVYPTRHFMIETRRRSLAYQDSCRCLYGGVYHHYKFRRDKERLRLVYELGDRRAPRPDQYTDLRSLDFHRLPSVIRDKFEPSS